MFLPKFLFPLQDLEYESRRGIGQDQSDEQSERPRRSKQLPLEHEGHTCRDDLNRAQQECIPTEQPGLPKIKLEADHEQEEHHAKFGKLAEPIDLRGSEEVRGSKDDAGKEQTQLGCNSKPTSQRN